MKISKSMDVVNDAAPSCEKGTGPFENPGIKPSESAIADTPGENATNDTSSQTESMNKGQPFKKGATAYD